MREPSAIIKIARITCLKVLKANVAARSAVRELPNFDAAEGRCRRMFVNELGALVALRKFDGNVTANAKANNFLNKSISSTHRAIAHRQE